MSDSLRRQIYSPAALFVFEAVARHGSFRAAALEMNVTQPSVSYQIKNLEKHLNTKLFGRRGRNIELTDDGESLYRAVEKGFSNIQAGLAEITRRNNGNLVTFCMSSSAAANFVLPNYPILRSTIPDLDLSIKIINRDINPAAENGDFAIRLGNGNWEDVDAWHMFDEVYFPVCAPGYFKDHKSPVTIEDIKASDLLFLKERHRSRGDWRSFFERVGSPLTVAHELITFDDQQALLASVVDGQGLGIGWMGMVDHLLATGAIVRPVDVEIRTGDAFYLIAPKDMRLSPVAADLRDWMLSEGAKIQKRWDDARATTK